VFGISCFSNYSTRDGGKSQVFLPRRDENGSGELEPYQTLCGDAFFRFTRIGMILQVHGIDFD
jgi:hypothetical protein